MSTKESINLLGKSILSKEIKHFLKTFDIPDNPKQEYEYSYDIRTGNETNGIRLEFNESNWYKAQYGEPILKETNDEKELILFCLSFGDLENNEKHEAKKIELPYNLILGDSSEKLIQKIGKKPKEKMPTAYGQAWWFQFEEYLIIAALDSNLELLWVRFMKLREEEKERIKLRKALNRQNKNIKPENIDTILKYKSNLPTEKWKIRKDEGDDIFTDQNIGLTENILKDYIVRLGELTSKKKASTIYNSVKKIVYSLNTLNDKHEFIETMEREELCEFINKIVRETGIEIDTKIDLTEEWREW